MLFVIIVDVTLNFLKNSVLNFILILVQMCEEIRFKSLQVQFTHTEARARARACVCVCVCDYIRHLNTSSSWLFRLDVDDCESRRNVRTARTGDAAWSRMPKSRIRFENAFQTIVLNSEGNTFGYWAQRHDDTRPSVFYVGGNRMLWNVSIILPDHKALEFQFILIISLRKLV